MPERKAPQGRFKPLDPDEITRPWVFPYDWGFPRDRETKAAITLWDEITTVYLDRSDERKIALKKIRKLKRLLRIICEEMPDELLL